MIKGYCLIHRNPYGVTKDSCSPACWDEVGEMRELIPIMKEAQLSLDSSLNTPLEQRRDFLDTEIKIKIQTMNVGGISERFVCPKCKYVIVKSHCNVCKLDAVTRHRIVVGSVQSLGWLWERTGDKKKDEEEERKRTEVWMAKVKMLDKVDVWVWKSARMVADVGQKGEYFEEGVLVLLKSTKFPPVRMRERKLISS